MGSEERARAKLMKAVKEGGECAKRKEWNSEITIERVKTCKFGPSRLT